MTRARAVTAAFVVLALCRLARGSERAECASASRACDGRVRAAAREDDALEAFTARARRDVASGGARAMERLANDTTTRGVMAEMLALGCCLFDGACGREGDASARARDVGARTLFEAARTATGDVPAWIGTLGGDAWTCASVVGTTTCDEALVEVYARAARGGDALGTLRAGDALLRRFVAGLATRMGGSGVVEECDVSLGGDVADAARAMALFKELLASEKFDKVAAERIREVRRAEELWIDPSRGGKPDKAYAMADALVRVTLRASITLAVVVVAYACRKHRLFGALWRFARSLLLFGFVVDAFKRARAFVQWLRWKPPVVHSRQARREEERRAKRLDEKKVA